MIPSFYGFSKNQKMEMVHKFKVKTLVFFSPSSKMLNGLIASFIERYLSESCIIVENLDQIDLSANCLYQVCVWSDVLSGRKKYLQGSPPAWTQIENNSFYILIDVPKGGESELHWFPYLQRIRGLFYTDDSVETLKKGLTTILAGDIWVPRKILSNWISTPLTNQVPEGYSSLSAREMSILWLVTEGKSNKEISNVLYISTNTVKTHLYNIYRKINVSNRLQAARWASQNFEKYSNGRESNDRLSTSFLLQERHR